MRFRRYSIGLVLAGFFMAGCQTARQCETYKPAVAVVPQAVPTTVVTEASEQKPEVIVQPTKTVVVAQPRTVVVAPSPRRAVRRAVRRHHLIWH